MAGVIPGHFMMPPPSRFGRRAGHFLCVFARQRRANTLSFADAKCIPGVRIVARILLIDDDGAGREMAAYNLRKARHRVDEAADGHSGIDCFAAQRHDVVITDVRMPEMSGIDVTREVHELDASVPVLVITAFGNIETAVEAMKAGAFDFLPKPFNRDQLLITVDKALEHKRLENENRELKRRLAGVERSIVFASPAMQELLAMTDRIAASEASVLIAGESGTGKELIARRIHSRSPRVDKPFITVNCGAIPADLIEAELFGHEKGAFTGADRAREGRLRQADGGTLFLDEVAELPPSMQVKLLRFLQEGTVDPLGSDATVSVDVRVIAAGNKDLHDEIKAGRFREDLYFRLNVIELSLPPLRERREDIAVLLQHFIDEFAAGRELEVSPELLHEVERRPWPGNVRELRNACERMVVLCTGETLTPDLLPPFEESGSADTTTQEYGTEAAAAASVPAAAGQPAATETAEASPVTETENPATAQGLPAREAGEASASHLAGSETSVMFPQAGRNSPWPELPEDGLSLLDLEKSVIQRVLTIKGGNVSEAARYLRIPRHILVYRISKYGIVRPR